MRAKTKHAIFSILTVEQQEKWQSKMKKRMERFKNN
jgi:Spy/CpxP family protein refolding chaperone